MKSGEYKSSLEEYLALIFSLLVIWFYISLGVSATKAISRSCGEEYPIEMIFSGNLMCSDEYKNE